MDIHTTLDIDATADQAWAVFGERFADIADWSDAILRSTLDGELASGAIRTCDIKAIGPVPATTITEELTQFDREHRRLAYTVLSGLPAMMKSTTNRWTFEDLDGGRARITSDATFTFAWWARPFSPLLRGQLAKSVRRFTESFGRYVEAHVDPVDNR